jgi:hypothetical protein
MNALGTPIAMSTTIVLNALGSGTITTCATRLMANVAHAAVLVAVGTLSMRMSVHATQGMSGKTGTTRTTIGVSSLRCPHHALRTPAASTSTATATHTTSAIRARGFMTATHATRLTATVRGASTSLLHLKTPPRRHHLLLLHHRPLPRPRRHHLLLLHHRQRLSHVEQEQGYRPHGDDHHAPIAPQASTKAAPATRRRGAACVNLARRRVATELAAILAPQGDTGMLSVTRRIKTTASSVLLGNTAETIGIAASSARQARTPLARLVLARAIA